MSSELPPALRAALERELEGVSRKGLAERAGRISAAYRAGEGSAGVIRGAEDALAYALARLPATHAACAAAFGELSALAPDFSPKGLLDAGAGPGAASWAAAEAWPQIEDLTWLDRSEVFLALARRLAADALPEPAVLEADLAAGGAWPRAELVVASYALAEIAPADLAQVVESLWAATERALVLVEPGTPAGFQRILAVRERLIGAGAEILAPCPHAGVCPITGPDWCHFSVRLPRSRDHRIAKGAEAPFEDEKFAYLIAVRPGVAGKTRSARILAPPQAGKAGTVFKLCGPQGLETRAVARRDKAGFAKSRRLGWGDRFA